MKFIWKNLKKRNKPPEWRLVPDAHGTYTLERWNDKVSIYLTIAVYVTPDEADEHIKNLKGNVIYYREESDKC